LRRLEELKILTRGALAEMRSLLLELRPSALIEVEISELLRQLTEAASARARIPVALEITGSAPLPQEVKIACYHIAQEALNNVIKHARARNASVTLQLLAGEVNLAIRDDGSGFVRQEVTPEHLGLTIMAERADGVGGTLHVESAQGAGTAIRFVWHPAGAAK
jgi:signal transduction histidine kinase